jgi:hypothetical protein
MADLEAAATAAELKALTDIDGGQETADERAGRGAIAAARENIASRRQQLEANLAGHLARIDTAIAALPSHLDDNLTVAAQADVNAATPHCKPPRKSTSRPSETTTA